MKSAFFLYEKGEAIHLAHQPMGSKIWECGIALFADAESLRLALANCNVVITLHQAIQVFLALEESAKREDPLWGGLDPLTEKVAIAIEGLLGVYVHVHFAPECAAA